MQSIVDWLRELGAPGSDLSGRALATLAVIVVFATLRYVAMRVVYSRTEDSRLLYQWRKTLTYFTFLLGFLAVGRIWIQGFESISTYLGLLSAGLAVALRDPIVNFAGWLFIIWRRPFDVGDRIQIGPHQGDVIDVRIFQFTLMEIGNWVDADQSTGRVIHIPNGKIFQEAQSNYSKGFEYIWNEIPVLVTFESNWKKAKAILTEVATKDAEKLSQAAEEKVRIAARKFMIFYTHLSPVVYTKIADSGVLLTIRYLCEPRKRRSTTERISEDVLARFADCDDIDFAYPTYRFYDNPSEGKSQARADVPERAG
ncbi:MAG TPA: mechanosensitive ion channel family protein [Vicinamibacteria bacterium]|nr:mechanosensitive ion channel family protein [Vicinamibacteria bacterium]